MAENAALLASLTRQHADIVAASQSSNADDEHDPEGSTIAFEREQVAALVRGTRERGGHLAAALHRLEQGTYGACLECGGPIAAERLQERPEARTCIRCAAAAGRR